MSAATPDPWAVADLLRARGLRWTPQRRRLVQVLAGTAGHVTGAELVERCRELDATTTPSTVYRTLDVLEELGLIRHGHGPRGQEEFHVLPAREHGHLYCAACGGSWELEADEAGSFVASIEARRGFRVNLSHVTVVGTCGRCREAATSGQSSGEGTPRMLKPPST